MVRNASKGLLKEKDKLKDGIMEETKGNMVSVLSSKTWGIEGISNLLLHTLVIFVGLGFYLSFLYIFIIVKYI